MTGTFDLAIQHFDIQRKVVAHKTTESWQTIPHASITYRADVTDFVAQFTEFRQTTQCSFNTMLLKIIAEGLHNAPILNSHIQYSYLKNEGQLIIHDQINIAMPMLTSDGRNVTVVVKDVYNKSVIDLANDVAELKRKLQHTNIDELLFQIGLAEMLKKLRKGHLGVIFTGIANLFGKHRYKPLKDDAKTHYYAIPESDRLVADDILPSTVLMSNVSALGEGQYLCGEVQINLLEIIAPCTTVVGISPIHDEVGVYYDHKEQKTGIRKILPITVAMDHRAFDGAHVAPFILKLNEIFLKPTRFFKMWGKSL